MVSRTWQGIDGEMDNASQTAYEDGDDATGDYALAIRETGWAAIGSARSSWPPDDDPITVTLDRDEWAFIVKSVKASDRIYVRLRDHDSLELGRRALEVIEPHL
jgi:hypothetical protein